MSEQQNKLAKKAADRLDGTYSDPKDTGGRMQWAATSGEANLVAPSPTVGTLPEGCAVSFARVWAGSDCYSTGNGNYGLGKSTLQKIAAAAGISWDPMASGRLDDGSHPHYCRWRAVGFYVAFDGTRQTIVAEKEMDLREGSAQVDALNARAASKGRAGRAGLQIQEMRLHIQSHAETKAQLRAVRSLGVRTGYSTDELQKPFVVARLMFTGETRDPVLRREFAMMTARSMMQGRSALFGNSGAPVLGASAAPPAALMAHTPPPPVGSTYDDETPPVGRFEAPPNALPSGTTLAQAANGELLDAANSLSAALDEGTSNSRDADERMIAAIENEIDRRAAGAR
jgi:hypothetical protein